MIAAARLRGIWSAVLTPVDASYAPDATLAIPYYAELLGAGCDGLNVLGTTGEAMSFSAGQRLAFMEAIANSLLPAERIMTGTGAASLADAARLMRGAFQFGFAAALVMPPFFYRDVTDDGVVRFFDALLSRSYVSGKSVVLYNFPKMSGITFHPTLIDRLLREFPGAIAGMKDSSNDRALQADVRARHSDFAIFPGSEEYLREAKSYGASGCISGSVCLWPALAKHVFETDDADRAGELAELRRSLPAAQFIAAVRSRVAAARSDEQWTRSVPPLA